MTSSENLFSFIGVLFAQIIAAGTTGQLIDTLLKKHHKIIIYQYLFREKNISFDSFEKSTINGLIEIFLYRDGCGHISPYKVAYLSTAFPIFAAIAILTSETIARGFVEQIFYFSFIMLLLTILNIYISFPIDFFSVYVTKKIFYKRDYSSRKAIFLWLFDMIISSIPSIIALIFIAISEINNNDIGDGKKLILGMFLGSITSTLIISILQIFIISIGSIIRGIIFITRFSDYIRDNTNSTEYPVTICLIFGAIVINMIILFFRAVI